MGTTATEVERQIQEARLHLARGELQAAVGRATEAIRLDCKALAAYLLRAESHRRLRKPERALADLAVAIRLDPRQPAPYVIRAEILKRRCLFDRAIADATHALCLDPRNAAAHSIRAQCRHAIGDREGATEDIQEMLLIDPTRPVPDLVAGPSSADPSSAWASDEERSRKRSGAGNRDDDRSVFADGKPVDRTYRSRHAVGDEDAPEALGVASGYKPQTIPRPIPRMRGRAERSPGRGGAILMLGVAMVLGCAVWSVLRGDRKVEPARSPASPRPVQVARSIDTPPAAAPAMPAAGEAKGLGPSAPAQSPEPEPVVKDLGPSSLPSPDLKPVVKDLGSFSLNKGGRSWGVVMPDRFTKAEVVFYRGDPTDRTLNAAWDGHLQINGRDVVRFQGSPRKRVFRFHDYTTATDYEEVNDYQQREPERLLDVTDYLHPGENSFYYYHEQRPDLPMGLVLYLNGGDGVSGARDAAGPDEGVRQAAGVEE